MAARPTAEQAVLAQILKAIRKRRGLTVAEVVDAMDIGIRAYSNFEAGRGKLSVSKIRRFSEITNADFHAIMIAREIRSPSFALRCLEHHYMSMLVVQIGEFDARTQDSFTNLDPRILFGLTRDYFETLITQTNEIEAALERWMLDSSLHETPPPDETDDDDDSDDDGQSD